MPTAIPMAGDFATIYASLGDRNRDQEAADGWGAQTANSRKTRVVLLGQATAPKACARKYAMSESEPTTRVLKLRTPVFVSL